MLLSDLDNRSDPKEVRGMGDGGGITHSLARFTVAAFFHFGGSQHLCERFIVSTAVVVE